MRPAIEWEKVRVWYSATHKITGMTHVVARVKGTGFQTRCGIRMYPSSKSFKLYEWNKGSSPIVPTCGQCLRLRKMDADLDDGR